MKISTKEAILMAKRRRIEVGMAVLFSALFGVIFPTMAAEFPTRAVTVYCAYAPGGSTDMALRILADTTKKHLGQTVVVENRTGGGGTVAAATMSATAKPDGYILASVPAAIFRYPHMMKTTFDPLTDFTYIINIASYTMGIVVRLDSPWKTFKDFMDYAKANPEKVVYASAGAGSTGHLVMEKLGLKFGLKFVHIPTKGGKEPVAALLGNQVNAISDSVEGVDPKSFRILATFGAQRLKRLADIPTAQELGYGFIQFAPLGIAGPKGMDAKIVKILHDAFKKGMDDPAYDQILEKYDMLKVYKNPQDYTSFARTMFLEEKEIIEKLGLKQQ
jgi:tripartite-type tricarboxylate transporter receptor subunit TctC